LRFSTTLVCWGRGEGRGGGTSPVNKGVQDTLEEVKKVEGGTGKKRVRGENRALPRGGTTINRGLAGGGGGGGRPAASDSQNRGLSKQTYPVGRRGSHKHQKV